jgi:hypothetical protein
MAPASSSAPTSAADTEASPTHAPRRRTAVALADLVRDGRLVPGPGVLSIQYCVRPASSSALSICIAPHHLCRCACISTGALTRQRQGTRGGAWRQGRTFLGDLRADGVIESDVAQAGVPQAYESVSAWSIVCKRTVNPSRMADDGWTSVRYRGQTLAALKEEARGHNRTPSVAAIIPAEGNGEEQQPAPAAIAR